MAERKTAEIKFRCTPSFKASVQAAAQVAELTMSEYIERACGDFVGKGLPLVVRQDWNIGGHDAVSSSAPGLIKFISTNVRESQPLTPEILDKALDLPQTQYPETADEALSCTCRPWEFCTHKASA